MKIFDTEDYDDETRHVLTAPPNWVIRNGIGVIFFVFIIILAVSYFIKYPDIITSEVTITSYHTPAEIKARASGRITLFTEENEFVKKGKVLGLISNPSNYNDILELKTFLAAIKPQLERHELADMDLPRQSDLGEVERSFVTFLTAVKEYLMFRQLDSHSKNIGELKRQVEIYIQLENQVNKQKSITATEVQIAKRKLEVDSVLLKEKVIPQLEYEKSVANYLPYKKQLEQIAQTLLSNSLRKAELESKISELTMAGRETGNRLWNAIFSSYNNLLSDLRMWDERYLLVAPIDGKVSFFKYWNNNQNVELSETILTVVPESNSMFGLILMPIQGSGKAKIGQRVNIRLHNFPYNEYGIIRGEVVKISTVPQNDMYAVTVKLNDGLTTSHGIALEFREQMKGSAEIVTNNLRLIERFFYQINKIIRTE